MRSMRIRMQTLFFMLIVAIASSPGFTFAQETSAEEEEAASGLAAVQISLRPLDGIDGQRFETEVQPGSTVELVAVVENASAEPIELRTYAADTVPVANGGLSIAEFGSEPTGSTTWMTYEADTRVFDPGELIEKTITISVPEGTPPGQYVNVLSLETVNPVELEGASSFDQFLQKLVSVYIVVPGPLEADFSVGEPDIYVQGTRGLVVLPLNNTGNVRVDLDGKVVLKDESGEVVLESDVVLGPVYSGQETVLQFGLRVLPPEGNYTVTVELTDNDSQMTHASGDMVLAVPAPESTETQAVLFENVVIEANADPIQFANVEVEVNSTIGSYRSARLTMSVSLDGGFVEDFVLADNLSLPQGTTTVQQRYLPVTGWESGTYTFSLTLEDTSSGGAIVIYSEDDVATIEVP